MSPSEQTNQATRAEWRDLGCYYDFEEAPARWRLVGSRSGLLHFRGLLTAYANNPQHSRIAAHEHYGPYFYLTVRTWNEPAITPDGIMGTLADIQRFAQLFAEKLQQTAVGELLTIDTEYADGSAVVLQCQRQPEGFDPASADPLLEARAERSHKKAI